MRIFHLYGVGSLESNEAGEMLLNRRRCARCCLLPLFFPFFAALPISIGHVRYVLYMFRENVEPLTIWPLCKCLFIFLVKKKKIFVQ